MSLQWHHPEKSRLRREVHWGKQTGLLISQKEFTSTSDPDRITQFEYNSRGELTKQIDDTGTSIYTHDPLKKQIRTGRWDKADNLLTWLLLHYNDNGQPTQIEELGKEPTTYKYDPSGNLTEINSSKSDLIKMTYDTKGQILSHATYDQNDETKISNEKFTCEPGGNIASYTNPQGEETKYFYTVDGKLLRQENSDGTTQEWNYQLDGRLIKQTLADGTTWETTYNDTERSVLRTLKNSSGETQKEERYGLDKSGNIISYTDGKNQTITRQYDKLNRLIAEIRPAETAEATPKRTDIAYNSNTITITNAGEKHTFTQDALGRITNILVQDANDQKISETTYAYSADKTTITETKDSLTTTTVADAKNDPVNWSDLATKIGLQAVRLIDANLSTAALGIRMAQKGKAYVDKKMGLPVDEKMLEAASLRTLQGVIKKWNAANEGPMGRVFDKEIYAISSLLRPLLGRSNQQFLANWMTGSAIAVIEYSEDSIQGRHMRESLNLNKAIDRYRAEGAQAKWEFNYETPDAYRETILNPFTANWHSTEVQVGGYIGTIVNNNDGTATYTIENIAGTYSFFYHALPNVPGDTGPMHNIKQVFKGTFPINPTQKQND